MDEDFMLWNFLEEERNRQSSINSDSGKEDEEIEDEDIMSEDELTDLFAEKLGQGLLRRGGNY